MKLRAASLLSWCAFAITAWAETTSRVVDIPLAGGITQRILYVRPDAPVANIVALPGGDGVLGILNDGTLITRIAACDAIARNRTAFADRNFALALVDANSAGAVWQYNDILEVIRWMRSQNNRPIWVIGGSNSTAAIVNLAVNLPGDLPVGAVIWAPQRPNTFVPSIRRPTFLIYHANDGDAFGALFFNALTTPDKDRRALSGGTDSGCGYHQFQGLDAQFVAEVSAFINRYNSSLAATTSINVQGLWWRSPAGTESGWGLNLTHQGDILFATWFTYDTDGRGLWLVASDARKTADNTYSGALYRTTGPAFSAAPFNSSQVVATSVGNATFTFTDANTGTFTYTLSGVTQTKQIARQVFSSPVPACSAGGDHGTPPNYQALWWNPAESGWGINVTHQGDILFATWFTYDTDGRGMWLVLSGAERTAAGVYSGGIYRTTGPAYNLVAWTGAVVATQVGTGTFTFSDANTGTFAYTVNGVSQAKRITRQVFASPASVCKTGAWDY